MSKEKMNEEMREINQESMSCSFVRGMGTGPDDCMDPADYEALDAAGALSSPVYVCGWGWTLPTVNVYGSGSGSGSDSNTGSGSDHDWEYGSGYNYGSGYGCGYNCGCNCNCGCDFCCGGYGSGYGSGCGCDCGCPFCGSGCGDTSGGTSGGSNNGNNENTDNNPVIKEPVELMDVSKFKGWYEGSNCFNLCAAMLDKYGIKEPGSPDNVFLLVKEEPKGDGTYELVNIGGKQNYLNTIECIDKHLDANRPIIVGVNHTLNYRKNGKPINEGTTDHFIVITGRGSDENGAYYTFMDPATGKPSKGCTTDNKLYDDADNCRLSGKTKATETEERKFYTVSQVRPNDGGNYETTSYKPIGSNNN